MNHTYAHPFQSQWGRLLARLFNSPSIAAARRALMSRMPFLVLESDVVDVVYATWLVDASEAARLAPPGCRLLMREGFTPLTILSYRHGHFGPRLLGPLRRFMPSPLQSNWRLYLAEAMPGGTPVATVAFVHNVMDSLLHVAATRVFSDALPSHWPRTFEFSVGATEAKVRIEPGTGSAPALGLRFERHAETELTAAWQQWFGNWREAVDQLATQHAAVLEVPTGPGGIRRVAEATISLPVDVSAVEPMKLVDAETFCPLLEMLHARTESLCFLLPRVRFAALSEKLL
ncbi:hypothetical protein [Xylophilus sp. GOD-11R]|uniref:hypothetical protein n=1 Tax=Xylophilus sp. GOD-11R TaxID=3089814 RepID=UPI00298C0583|nr:hypothetical protein [Xylophilus sp. GOD-11R]WPB58865.1 hypothetical protein R9X41_09595 [Xylophilus sp. GOD-11R]